MHKEAVKKLLLDVTEVLTANGVAIGIMMTGVEFLLKIIAAGIAIGYTLWKWKHEIDDRRNRASEINENKID